MKIRLLLFYEDLLCLLAHRDVLTAESATHFNTEGHETLSHNPSSIHDLNVIVKEWNLHPLAVEETRRIHKHLL